MLDIQEHSIHSIFFSKLLLYTPLEDLKPQVSSPEMEGCYNLNMTL